MSSLDNGVLEKRPRSTKLGGFADLLANGESPNGLMVQTVNGTSREDGRQARKSYVLEPDRWCNNDAWNGDMSGL